MTRARTSLIAALIAAAGALSAWSVTGLAGTRAAPTQPARIGILDLQRAYLASTELAARGAETKALAEKLKAELTTMQNQLKDLRAQLDNEPPSSPRRRDLMAEGVVLQAMLETKEKVAQRLVDLSNGESVRVVYSRLTAACDKLLATTGLDLIIVDDRSVQPGADRSEQDVTAAIQSRQILAASKAMDVTDEVVQIMNNDYAAGGPASGTTPKR